ncbi:hypothetical protein HanPI659440_Chr04g0177121 [Helianthus annuus]|nr:hypothetical protein HanPI659440_Chr04g0177121 [Helianthus annuus]
MVSLDNAKSYKIGGLRRYAWSSQIANALLENFSRDANVIYPVFGVISVGDLSSDLAKIATNTNPFVHAGSSIADDDLHAVLITGIYVVSLNPLRISVEIKNSYGEKWGTTDVLGSILESWKRLVSLTWGLVIPGEKKLRPQKESLKLPIKFERGKAATRALIAGNKSFSNQ